MKKFFLILIVFSLSIYWGRHWIFEKIFEKTLESKTGEKVTSARCFWEGEKLIYEGLSLGNFLYLPHLEIDWRWNRLSLQPHIHLAIDHHALQEITPLALSGTLSTELDLHFKGRHLSSVTGFATLDDVHFDSNGCILDIDQLTSQIDWQGKNLTWNASWEGLDLFWEELELLRSQGTILTEPGKKPTFLSHALLNFGRHEGEIDISGQGVLDLEGVHHLEGEATFTSQTPSQVEFSYAHELLSAFGKWGDIPFSLEFKEPFSDFNAKLQMTLPLFDESPAIVEAHLERQNQQFHVEGLVFCQSESVEFEGTTSFSFESWNIQFQGKELDAAFFNRFSNPFLLEGAIDVSGTFTENTLDLALHPCSLVLIHPTIPLMIKMESGFTVSDVLGDCKIENFAGAFLHTQLPPIPFSSKMISFQAGKWNFDATLSTPHPLSFQGELTTLEKSYTLQLQQLDGEGKLSLVYTPTDDQITYLFNGSHLHYGSSHFEALQARLIQQGNRWTLEEGCFNHLLLKGAAEEQGDHWVIPSLEVAGKDFKAAFSGLYGSRKFDFHVDAKLLSRFDVRGRGLLNVAASHIQNLSLQVQDQNAPVASFKTDLVQYQAGKWSSSALETTFFSSHFQTPLQTTLHFSASPDSFHFQGPFSQGKIEIDKHLLELKEIYGLYENGFLNLKCPAQFHQKPLQLMGKFSGQSPFGGTLQVKEGLHLLNLSFSDPSTLEAAEGECFGIHSNLRRNGKQFEGHLVLEDSGEFLEGFPAAHLELNGRFEKLPEGWTFQGDLKAEDLLVKDRRLQEISSYVNYTPRQFQLKEFAVTDAMGSCLVRKCDGLRKTPQDPWQVSIPLLKAQEIRLGAKPLVIRNLILSDLKGELGNLTSFQGQGSFNFSQTVKKDPSLFDIPKNFFKDLGLDFDLCTPVTGEVAIQLREGKCFFTDFQNVLSEGARSTFLLDSSRPSYLDSEGRLSLHLRMLQAAPLKLIEPFTITVEGTWEKPRYILR